MVNIVKDYLKTTLNATNLKIGDYTFTFDKKCTAQIYKCSGCNNFGVSYNVKGMVEDKYKYTTFDECYIKLVYCNCWNDDNKHDIYVNLCVYDKKNSQIPTNKLGKGEWQFLSLHLNEKSENKNESSFVKYLIENSINIFGKDKVFVNY